MIIQAFPLLALVPTLVNCVASTDSLQDAVRPHINRN